MKLIIDAGSTKSEWLLLDGGEVESRFQTDGFNPNYGNIRTLETIVETRLISSLKEIHYYGTGCGSEQNRQLIKEVFQKRFPNTDIHVTHDLMAACHAVLGHEKGIACILGTGSNSCVYDGEDITERAVSLGYLVGDEGSGMHIGKEVVKAYFYGFMPEDLKQSFDAAYHLELKDFIQHFYHGEWPSRYLASFAKFAGEHQTHPYIKGMVKDCFRAFIEAFVLRFEECKSLKISFVGSVAYHFRAVLEEALADYGLTMGEVMSAPAEGLIRYYRNLPA